MLSATEYEQAKYDYEHTPSSMTGKRRQHYRSHLRKRIKEHECASRYPSFQPLSYQLHFINRLTEDGVLQHIIDAAAVSTGFTMDTESVNVYKQCNRPALIQLQILSCASPSIVLLIEIDHLPQPGTHTFEKIRQLFSVVFNPLNDIYMWGSVKELDSFIPFQLFSSEQVRMLNATNVQILFQEYWRQSNLHIASTDCACENCLGRTHDQAWSLQDAIACALHEWLDKRTTRSPFNIGLDSTLRQGTTEESSHIVDMIRYAANDCLALEKLLIYMQERPPCHSLPAVPRYEPISSDDEHDVDDRTERGHSEKANNHERLDDASNVFDQQACTRPDQQDSLDQHPRLSAEDRRRIHNRRCTLKQRRRSYTYEIIRRDVDRRFRITDVKRLLRDHCIPFLAVNISTSRVSGKTSIYIGIRDRANVRQYESMTRTWFTSQHYRCIHRNDTVSDNARQGSSSTSHQHRHRTNIRQHRRQLNE